VIPPHEHDEQRVAIITGASQGIGQVWRRHAVSAGMT